MILLGNICRSLTLCEVQCGHSGYNGEETSFCGQRRVLETSLNGGRGEEGGDGLGLKMIGMGELLGAEL